MKKTIATVALGLALVVMIGVPTHHAFGQTMTIHQSDMWHLWVFIYNFPPDAHNIRLALVDDSNRHNELTNATVGPDNNATGDPRTPTATWRSFDIPTSWIGDGTGYYVCMSGEDIKNQCTTIFTHNGNNTNTYTGIDWAGLNKANSTNDNATITNETAANTNQTNNQPQQQQQQQNDIGTAQPPPYYTTRTDYDSPGSSYRGSWGFHCWHDDYNHIWHCPDSGNGSGP